MTWRDPPASTRARPPRPEYEVATESYGPDRFDRPRRPRIAGVEISGSTQEQRQAALREASRRITQAVRKAREPEAPEGEDHG